MKNIALKVVDQKIKIFCFGGGVDFNNVTSPFMIQLLGV